MKRFVFHIIAIISAVTIMTALFSCNIRNKDVVAEVDALNGIAYNHYYMSIDSVEKYASKALEIIDQKGAYADGKDEAFCNLGFAKYMRMDYDSAHFYLQDVIDNSSNELYRFMADVIMMRVCQRRSENKLFYDYHNDAEEKISRIRPELSTMSLRQKKIWNFALSDYHMALYTYYYYLRQEDDGNKELIYIADNMSIVNDDPAQTALYFFLFGNARNIDNRLTDDDSENLLEAASIANTYNLHYILAKSLTSIAEDIIKGNYYRPSKINIIKELIAFGDTIPDSQLPLTICEFALDKFIGYGSLFDVAQTYNTIADYYLSVEQPDKALENMELALDCVNRHHQMVADDNMKVVAFEQNEDTISTEKKWIDTGVVCLPEWMADIREHLSIVFSSMGMKRESDYNWNIYLDIFETTRQDKKMEQLHSTLEKEQKDLNRFLFLSAIVLALLAALLLYLTHRIKLNYRQNYMKERKAVEQAMLKWRQKTDDDFSTLEEHQETAIAERVSKERRLEEQKRQYINKSTCLSIVYAINPFLDRTVNEVNKIKELNDRIYALPEEDRKKQIKENLPVINGRLQYVSELIERINVYNDILADWIKIRQGEVSLNIESFELMPLFAIMQKNNRMFQAKNINLHVEPTEAVVKADRALTLFMMNTLLENARKYTQEGGEVKLFTKEEDSYVEISVQDNGAGMSKEDVNTVLEEKVYDSSKIGEADHNDELIRNKGFGFGLLNCKGIIEKYKKTNPLFCVCKFGIESELGKGSRFFFRLPKGVLRNLMAMALLILQVFSIACSDNVEYVDPVNRLLNVPQDNQAIQDANYYAEMAKLSNESQQYEQTLLYADSAICRLNDYYLEMNPDGADIMMLYDDSQMAEIKWIEQEFPTEYYAIMQIRNEVAIAALGLYQTDLYYYNNYIFSILYKLTSRNQNLGQSCAEIKEANNNRKTLIFILLATVLIGGMVYYFIYYRNNILPTFTMRQILELNRRIFNNQDEQKLATIIHQGVNDIRRTDGVGLLLNDGQLLFSENCPKREYVASLLQKAAENQNTIILDKGKTRIYPLNIDNGNCIGMILFQLFSENIQKDDDNMFRMISQYTAENIYYSTVRMEHLHADIESIEDERRRAEREANIVHVQNLVIDNTLSTIKHETMYYPNRIRQIVDNVKEEGFKHDDELVCDKVNTISELTLYYKEIFGILADCASKQIHKPMFKRKFITITDVVEMIRNLHRKYANKSMVEIKLSIDTSKLNNPETESIIADHTMFSYLLQNLIEAVFQEKKPGTLAVDFEKSEDFIKFAFAFDNLSWNEERFKNIFYPETLAYNPDNNVLRGAQMLIAKQIIREHDEYVRRGCRIYAKPASDHGQGVMVCFTIPAQKA